MQKPNFKEFCPDCSMDTTWSHTIEQVLTDHPSGTETKQEPAMQCNDCGTNEILSEHFTKAEIDRKFTTTANIPKL